MNEISAALQSGSILLREGLEALLVIAAVAAFVKRAGVPEKVRRRGQAGLLILPFRQLKGLPEGARRARA